MASMGHKGNLLAAPVPAFPQSPQPADGRYSPPQRPQQMPSPMLLSADFVTKHGQNVPVPQMDFSPPDNKKNMKSSSSSFKNLIPPIFTGQSSQKNVFNGPRDDPLARPYQVDGMEHVRLFDNWNQATQGSASARRKSTDETYLNARAGWKEYQKKYLGEQGSGRWDFSPPSPRRTGERGVTMDPSQFGSLGISADSAQNRTGLPTPNYRQGEPTPIQNSGPGGYAPPEEEYEKFCLGIVWVLKAGRLLVAGFNPRSTAHTLGVRSGDILKSVDGIEVLNLSTDFEGRHEAGELMVGREDTQCKLTLLRLVTREDKQQLYQIDVTLPRSISVMDLNVQSY
mmetsp:Transcript_13247/g.31094  ORF Transcript_13247/g.31094 Transcript_13247/m.31094 type:complete len:340 (+) Transcript_13247:201-1220(+)